MYGLCIIYTDLYTYFQNQKADHHYFEMRKTLIDHLKTTKSPVIVNVDDFTLFSCSNVLAVSVMAFNEADVTVRELELLKIQANSYWFTRREKIRLNIPGVQCVQCFAAVAGVWQKGWILMT